MGRKRNPSSIALEGKGGPRLSLRGPATRPPHKRMSAKLKHLHLSWMHNGAPHSVCSPPPCGEGLGVGVRQRITARPPPRRSAAKLARAAQAWLRAPTLPTRGRVGPSSPLALIPLHLNTV